MVEIRNIESIIGLRNFLVRAYDTIKRSPELKEDIDKILRIL